MELIMTIMTETDALIELDLETCRAPTTGRHGGDVLLLLRGIPMVRNETTRVSFLAQPTTARPE